MKNLIIIVLSAFFLTACGSSDSKISKGHRDAINQQCKESSDIKACALEVRANFLAEGNEFITLDELNKDQKRKIRMECVLSKKFGLEAYNTCLEDYKIAALDGDLFKNVLPRIPKSNIEKLETLTVKIEIVESQDDEKIYLVGSGSGVILNKELVATNCHVALGSTEKPNRALIIKHINKESYAIATIYKKAVTKRAK